MYRREEMRFQGPTRVLAGHRPGKGRVGRQMGYQSPHTAPREPRIRAVDVPDIRAVVAL